MTRSKWARPVVVGVLSKVLKILDVLQTAPSGLTLKQVTERTGINASTAYRFLTHLEREGYLSRDGAGSYTLGIKLLLLGARATRETSLRETAAPVMRELAAATGETVNLGVMDQGMVLYADVVESHHAFRLVSRIGMRRPLHATALGKAMMAFLEEDERERILAAMRFESLTPHTIASPVRFRRELETIRRQGFAVDNEEVFLGARCIAVPILNEAGESVGAISIAGPTTRISQEEVQIFAASVMDAAQRISAQIGYSQPAPTAEVPAAAGQR